MRVCGVDYQGQDLIPVVIEHKGEGWEFLETMPQKITLKDIYDTEQVRLFGKAVEAFVNEHAVDQVAVKKRATSGIYAGGAASFRMGGVLQVVTEKPVLFVSPQAVAAAIKESGASPPDTLKRYQEKAFEVAMACAARLD